MIFYIHVGVALHRPPAIHEYRRYAIEAPSGVQAKEIALQMASCTSVMPVWASIESYDRGGERWYHWRHLKEDRSHCLVVPDEHDGAEDEG
jgi:hypothetical protein